MQQQQQIVLALTRPWSWSFSIEKENGELPLFVQFNLRYGLLRGVSVCSALPTGHIMCKQTRHSTSVYVHIWLNPKPFMKWALNGLAGIKDDALRIHFHFHFYQLNLFLFSFPSNLCYYLDVYYFYDEYSDNAIIVAGLRCVNNGKNIVLYITSV